MTETNTADVTYAAPPDEGEPWRGHKFKEVQRGCWRCDCGKTIKEAASDQSTPASGGNYPVMPKRYTVDDDGEELFTAEKMRAFADATCALRATPAQFARGFEAAKAQFASRGQAPVQATPAYKDSTPELHIGDSAFESWYSTYSPAHKSDKQRARDAYAAGMGAPMVTYAPLPDEREAFEAMMRSQTFDSLKRLSDGSYESYEARVGWLAWNVRASPCAAGATCTGACPRDALTQATRDVLAERQRQISAEGWTPEHDDEHLPGELSLAAASYVCADEGDAPPTIWPWDWSWWKPRDRRRNLVKSGALVLAELERIDRAEAARAEHLPQGKQ